jgi:hypothetical protein
MCGCNKIKITKTAGKAAKEAKSGKQAKGPLRKKIKLPKK